MKYWFKGPQPSDAITDDKKEEYKYQKMMIIYDSGTYDKNTRNKYATLDFNKLAVSPT